MSLATRCPYCRTTFRVTHDQLKLRGGLVRCGACKEIFNGVEHLLPSPSNERYGSRASTRPATESSHPDSVAEQQEVDSSAAARDEQRSAHVDEQASGDPSTATDPASGPTMTPDAATANAIDVTQSMAADDDVANTESDTEGRDFIEPTSRTESESDAADSADSSRFETDHPRSAISRATDADADQPDPLTRMTLMDIRPEPAAGDAMTQPAPRRSHDADEISQAIDDLQSRPWRSAAVAGDADQIDALDNDEPEFVRKARQHQQQEKRLRRLLKSGIVVLGLLALLQATLASRTWIAAQWPATMPLLAGLCEPFGCDVSMPAQIEYVTIESHELHAMPASDNTFTLNLLIRNRSNVMQAWPHLQLSLNDPSGEPLLRRVLAPADYLGSADGGRGITAHSERPIRVGFAVDQLKASGYVLHLFYP